MNTIIPEGYVFNAELYAVPGDASGEYSDTERQEIAVLRESYPELARQGWGEVALTSAWVDFSQTIHMTGWVENLARDENFLLFLFCEQEGTSVPWGTPGETLPVLADPRRR